MDIDWGGDPYATRNTIIKTTLPGEVLIPFNDCIYRYVSPIKGFIMFSQFLSCFCFRWLTCNKIKF